MKKLDNFSNCLSVLKNADFKLAENNEIYREMYINQSKHYKETSAV